MLFWVPLVDIISKLLRFFAPASSPEVCMQGDDLEDAVPYAFFSNMVL